MSLVKTNAVQVGQSATASQNFTITTPTTPDGSLKISRGNAGATTGDVIAVNANGAVGFGSTPSYGSTGQVLTSAGTGNPPTWNSPTTYSGGDSTNNIGYLNIPQNSLSAAYTLVLSDAGKHIYHPSADTTARTWTIPANSSVPFPIGTAITFINDTSAGTITISITTDTLVLSPAGTTGSRTLAVNGVATAIKVTSTRWIISGTGLT